MVNNQRMERTRRTNRPKLIGCRNFWAWLFCSSLLLKLILVFVFKVPRTYVPFSWWNRSKLILLLSSIAHCLKPERFLSVGSLYVTWLSSGSCTLNLPPAVSLAVCSISRICWSGYVVSRTHGQETKRDNFDLAYLGKFCPQMLQ